MTWNFDLITIPRGRTDKRVRVVKGDQREHSEFTPEWIWAATAGGEVLRTHWIPQRGRDGGRWLGMNKGDEPIAWRPFVRPAHPFANRLEPGDVVTMSPELASSLGFSSTEFMINDVGGEV